MGRRLYRSKSDRMISGVCGGLATYFDMDPTVVRVIAVLLLLFTSGAALIAYIIMAIVIPVEGSKSAEPKDTVKENVDEMKESATELGRELQSTFAGDKDETQDETKIRQRRRNLFGIILIIIGVLFLLGSFDLFWWFQWGYLWPVIIIIIGALIIFSTRRR